MIRIVLAIPPSVPGVIFTNVADAMLLNFNETKLNENYYCAIVCDGSTASFKDRWSEDCGYVSFKNGDLKSNGCITDLMIFIKYHVEQQFRKSIQALNSTCPLQKRTQQQSTTGSRFLFKLSQ